MRRGTLAAPLLAWVASACAAPSGGSPGPEATASRASVELAQGYALLHSLVSHLRAVDDALVLTSESDAYHTLIVDIAEQATDTREMLEAWARTDPTLVLHATALPAAERAARTMMADRTEARLLFGVGNDELRLLLTQIEATRYARALAAVASRRETDRARIRALEDTARRFGELHERAIAHLELR